MAQTGSAMPRRFAIARRWQWPAMVASALFVATCFIGWPYGVFWPSIVAFGLFVPAIWLFSIKCHRCGFPAFADYQADHRLAQDEGLQTRFWGKEFGGVHLPLRSACSKCGQSFTKPTE